MNPEERHVRESESLQERDALDKRGAPMLSRDMGVGGGVGARRHARLERRECVCGERQARGC